MKPPSLLQPLGSHLCFSNTSPLHTLFCLLQEYSSLPHPQIITLKMFAKALFPCFRVMVGGLVSHMKLCETDGSLRRGIASPGKGWFVVVQTSCAFWFPHCDLSAHNCSQQFTAAAAAAKSALDRCDAKTQGYIFYYSNTDRLIYRGVLLLWGAVRYPDSTLQASGTAKIHTKCLRERKTWSSPHALHKDLCVF